MPIKEDEDKACDKYVILRTNGSLGLYKRSCPLATKPLFEFSKVGSRIGELSRWEPIRFRGVQGTNPKLTTCNFLVSYLHASLRYFIASNDK